MIADFETNIVYFSELLRSKVVFSGICKRICDILDSRSVKYDFLKATKDIWARDYMPIQINDDRFIQFRYEPSYLKDSQELQSDPQTVCKLNNITPTYSQINLDGGNVVKWTDKVLITDRIFSENPEYISKNQLVRDIEILLEAEVIIIPQIKSDFTGHADGLVRFIDSETILVSDLNSEYKYWSQKMHNVISDNNLKHINMSLFEYNYKQHPDSAIGCYMNYLEIGDLILFPIFEVAGNKDQEAVDLITELYPHKTIEPININPIANEGGLMNCISWNIKF